MSRKQKVGGFHTPFAGLEALKKQLAPPPAPARKTAATTPSVTPPASKQPLTDEELFLQEVGGVAPIPEKKKGERVGGPHSGPPGGGAARARSGPVGDEAEVLAQLADLCDGNGVFDIADSDEYIEGVAEGIDKRLLRRLRAGEYAVQAHVDLHGSTRDEAKAKVAQFVAESRRAGRRCVLIVHGRGLHSKDQIPVLKDAVRTWLERGQIAKAVLAFATARPHDGGAGAVYVLLRR